MKNYDDNSYETEFDLDEFEREYGTSLSEESDEEIEPEYIPKHSRPEPAEQGSLSPDLSEEGFPPILPDEEELPAEKLRRSGRGWRRFLLIYAVCFLLIGAIGCFVLYRYAAAYEASLPENIMDEVMVSKTADDWYDIARSGVDFEVSEFENGEELFNEYYDAVIRSSGFTYRKAAGEYSEDAPAFTVRAGGTNLCNVYLKPDGDKAAGFGRNLWRLDTIRSCFEMDELASIAVEIDTPKNTVPRINGVPLSDSYVVDESIPIPDMQELERSFDSPATYRRYRVNALYGSITVTDDTGHVLTVSEQTEGTVRYLIPTEELYSFTVRAPEGVKVSLCGMELRAGDAVTEPTAILDGFDAYTDGSAYNTLTWSFEGLYTEPKVTAVAEDGTELTPLVSEKGDFTICYPNEEALSANVSGVVEEFFNRYIKYSSQAYDEGRYWMLLNTILPETELYCYIRDSVDAMIWASATEVSYDELTFTDFHSVSEKCFTCTIRYKADFAAQAWYESYTYDLQNAYEVSFVLVGDMWYAAAMSAIE